MLNNCYYAEDYKIGNMATRMFKCISCGNEKALNPKEKEFNFMENEVTKAWSKLLTSTI